MVGGVHSRTTQGRGGKPKVEKEKGASLERVGESLGGVICEEFQ